MLATKDIAIFALRQFIFFSRKGNYHEDTSTHHHLVYAMIVSLASCAGLDTNQKQGTAIGAGVGAGVGAVLGQAIGRNTGSTLTGAGIAAAQGGVAGNQIGLYMDNQERELAKCHG